MEKQQAAVARTFSDADIAAAVRAVFPESKALILFGSHASGDVWVESDLDLAILLPGRGDPVHIWEGGQAIAARLQTHIDLVDICSASTVMQYQIITKGRRLFADGSDLDTYEMYILREMLDFNRGRAALLEDIRREGHVYAR